MTENQDKADYMAAQAFLAQPRCIMCEHYQTDGKAAACTKNGEIPAQFLYTPNECPDYEYNIVPF